MTPEQPRITVCVCTFKRAELLPELVRHIQSQRTGGGFALDLVIVDNDTSRSAEGAVRELAATSTMRITYSVEPDQNIALARNRAVSLASGDLLAFIDDDELPAADWLYQLFQARVRFGVDGVLGPVLPRFEQPPPLWIARGKFFDRKRHVTGTPVVWTQARTGNVLVNRATVNRLEPPFRPQFNSGGEDIDFFCRVIGRGASFVWCDEAAVWERISPNRCTRGFLIRRALLRGSNFPKWPAHRMRSVLRSLVAVPLYAVALPLLFIAPQHVFMGYLIRLLEHSARLLAFAGLPVLSQREM